MKRVGLLGIALAFVLTAFAAATPAFASTQNLSGTVTTNNGTGIGGGFAESGTTSSANITGAADGTFFTVVHSPPPNNSTGVWTISATIGGLTQSNVALTFYVAGASNIQVAAVTRIEFTDTSGNLATLNLSIIGGTALSLTPTGALTINTALASYTLTNNSGTFNANNINKITFDISLAASGNNRALGLDAVDVIDTPEPSTLALFGLGLAGLGGGLLRRRRARRAAAVRAAA